MGDYDSPKVTKLDKRHPLACHDEGVLRLQVSVHNALSVTVLKRNDQLQAKQMFQQAGFHNSQKIEPGSIIVPGQGHLQMSILAIFTVLNLSSNLTPATALW